MSIVMKALKDFRGKSGEGNVAGSDRLVAAGPEFKVSSQKRADDLESRGFAVPVKVSARPIAKMEARPQNKMDTPPANKGAEARPLAGGKTGAENVPSSSDQDRPPRRRRSRKHTVVPDLLPSTNPGG